VMKDGEIMQVAAPLAVYNQPANLFVAGFIGSPPMNFFKGTVRRTEHGLQFIEAHEGATPVGLILNSALAAKASSYVGRAVVFGVRPEDIREPTTPDEPGAEATIEMVEPMGAETYLHLSSGASSFIARVRPTDAFQIGQRIKLVFNLDKAHLFDATTEAVI
jgi:multiple sugar transport system ATP-binding protein